MADGWGAPAATADDGWGAGASGGNDNSWNDPGANDNSSWKDPGAGSGDFKDNGPSNDNDDAGFGNGDDDGYNGGGGGGGKGCHNCGEEGHFSRECDKPRKVTCNNCGKEGHMRMDCPNPRVETRACRHCNEVGHLNRDCPQAPALICRNCKEEGHGIKDCPTKPPLICRNCKKEGHGIKDCPTKPPLVCRHCNEEGHGIKDCPTAPPPTCKNCSEEGHTASACTKPRNLLAQAMQMESDEAWNAIVEADRIRDLDELRSAFYAYAKANPELTFVDIEKKFREKDLRVHILALQKELIAVNTLVDLQGQPDRQFTISFNWGPKLRRNPARQAETPEENLERLANAGLPMQSYVLFCIRCKETGHSSRFCIMEAEKPELHVGCINCGAEDHRFKACPQPRSDNPIQANYGGGSRECFNCGKTGHSKQDCPDAPSGGGRACFNCGEEGHSKADCPNPSTGGGRACFNCGEEGHSKIDCPNPRQGGGGMACFNCGEEGHSKAECTNERNPNLNDDRACFNCGQKGHTSRDCTEPRSVKSVICRQCNKAGHFSRDCPGDNAVDDEPVATNDEPAPAGGNDWMNSASNEAPSWNSAPADDPWGTPSAAVSAGGW